ncbi:hypothetical protein BABINDRAFT_160984 [Babjeviella inositovora NRRL Y-12698]|uniref:Zn(2)-C6 fungal-type domain-containing protein n=1 Tax=Babjeviella inositovora NRRL Y-12698 TaxID=984486 RepID=A0A1E3QSX4_9ASCO|nr:uncharacterized protein BABINDRAFT_160984 [Babjeviella inositovora NRRL Y-12698]ODQ80770.1 hypothetical protein BABINDRAFT_160984 [Babjeviella inositovora NRRL Y-12698]
MYHPNGYCAPGSFVDPEFQEFGQLPSQQSQNEHGYERRQLQPNYQQQPQHLQSHGQPHCQLPPQSYGAPQQTLHLTQQWQLQRPYIQQIPPRNPQEYPQTSEHVPHQMNQGHIHAPLQISLNLPQNLPQNISHTNSSIPHLEIYVETQLTEQFPDPYLNQPLEEFLTYPSQLLKKRTRIPTTCSVCRKRKLKCDRHKPYCQNCQENDSTALCRYAKHAWQKSIIRDTSLVEDVAKLRKQVAALELRTTQLGLLDEVAVMELEATKQKRAKAAKVPTMVNETVIPEIQNPTINVNEKLTLFTVNSANKPVFHGITSTFAFLENDPVLRGVVLKNLAKVERFAVSKTAQVIAPCLDSYPETSSCPDVIPRHNIATASAAADLPPSVEAPAFTLSGGRENTSELKGIEHVGSDDGEQILLQDSFLTASQSFTKRMHDKDNETSKVGLLTSDRSRKGNAYTIKLKILLGEINKILPRSISVILLLVKHFFRTGAFSMAFIDPQSFLEELDSFLFVDPATGRPYFEVGSDYQKLASVSMLLLILRVAYLSLPLRDLLQPNWPERYLKIALTADGVPMPEGNKLLLDIYREIYLPGIVIDTKFVESARTCFAYGAFHENVSFRSVQALLLCQLYWIYAPEDGDEGADSSTLLAMLVQMAQLLGLHRELGRYVDVELSAENEAPTDCSNYEALTKRSVLKDKTPLSFPQEHPSKSVPYTHRMLHLRRKVWHEIVYLDAYRAMKFGCPLVIKDDAYDTQLPHLYPELIAEHNASGDTHFLQREKVSIAQMKMKYESGFLSRGITRRCCGIRHDGGGPPRAELELAIELIDKFMADNHIRLFEELAVFEIFNDGRASTKLRKAITEDPTSLDLLEMLERAHQYNLRLHLMLLSFQLHHIISGRLKDQNIATNPVFFKHFGACLEKGLILFKQGFDFLQWAHQRDSPQPENLIPLQFLAPSVDRLLGTRVLFTLVRANWIVVSFSIRNLSKKTKENSPLTPVSFLALYERFLDPDSRQFAEWLHIDFKRDKANQAHIINMMIETFRMALPLREGSFFCLRVCLALDETLTFLQHGQGFIVLEEKSKSVTPKDTGKRRLGESPFSMRECDKRQQDRNDPTAPGGS